MGGIKFTRLHTPKGTRDILPSEIKEYQYVEDQLKEIFNLWDYNEVRSPTIEFVETLSTGVGSELIEAMFKFQDFDGKLLALRPEMTAPVARIVTTRMQSAPEPIRLFYINNVFRYSQSYLKREREFCQAGVELIGCNTPKADAEILSLLISSLKKVGLTEIRIDLGHASLLKNLITVAELNNQQKNSLRTILGSRDFVGLKKFMEKNNFPSNLKDVFLELSECRKLNEVSSISLNGSNYEKANKQLRNLIDLQKMLIEYKIEDNVFFDFSLTKKIDYYTGMVFEASVPNLGLPIGSGGRYDNFIEKFGNLQLSATGFALEIGKLIQALEVQGFNFPDKTKTKVIVSSNFIGEAIEAVQTLRDSGIVASIDIKDRNFEKTVEFGKLSEIDYVLFINSSLKNRLTVYNIKSDSKTQITFQTFLKNIGGQIT
ncbi:ATP phosphoribosyltransferase regulatory subunit [Candidatus Bathyarchaeota archaeon]|nr:ATP phosphoribosyltransferase regulatory subunit [Candidatus Bathyarchaeota archaeon]